MTATIVFANCRTPKEENWPRPRCVTLSVAGKPCRQYVYEGTEETASRLAGYLWDVADILLSRLNAGEPVRERLQAVLSDARRNRLPSDMKPEGEPADG